jgi:hypothetical protein
MGKFRNPIADDEGRAHDGTELAKKKAGRELAL